LLELDTRDITRQSILAQIESYITTLPEYDRWKDFFEASTGVILLDILTGITELLLYKLEIRSKDSYLPTAISESAVYLLSQMLGYNPNRKTHSLGTVEIYLQSISPVSITIQEGYEIDYIIPLTVSETTVLPAGSQSVVVPVIQGKWVEVEYSVANGNLIGRDWESILIDEEDFVIDHNQIYVTVNNVNIDIVDKIELVTNNSVIARTDYRGGVALLFGDGQFGVRLSPSTVVNVRYLKTLGIDGTIDANIDLGNYLLGSNIILVKSNTIITGGSAEDSIEKVKYLASRFFQTQGRAVTAYDFEAIILSYPGVISATAWRCDDGCCEVMVCGLKDTHLPWEQLEVDSLLSYLDTYKMLSTLVTFKHPEPISLNLKLRIVVPVFSDTSMFTAEITDYIITNYCYKLTGRFYSTKVVDDLADYFTNVIRVYVDEVNGDDTYPDLLLQNWEYFDIGIMDIEIETV